MSLSDRRPIAYPVAWSSNDESPQVTSDLGATRRTKLRRDTSAFSGGRRASARQLEVVRRALGERDWAVIRSVAGHRFLTTSQVEQLHFHDHASPLSAARTARRVLRRLAGDRVLEHLARRIGGVRAGSSSYVWRLGPLGHRLLHGDSGRSRRSSEPGLRYLDHCLAVADVHLQLITAARNSSLQLLDVALEPEAWRSYLGQAGQRLTLKPDLFAITSTGAYEDCWFLEIDRGTESLPTVLRQCRQYEAYRRSGREQEQLGTFPLVVWLVGDQVRRERLREGIASTAQHPALFRVVRDDGFLPLLQGRRPGSGVESHDVE